MIPHGSTPRVTSYDALCTQRPYKTPFDQEDALRSLCEGARTGHFDPELVRVFLEQASANGHR
jgi:HD-GYP domain-containing protein (c-di-GMP phosphodiesterase class II)